MLAQPGWVAEHAYDRLRLCRCLSEDYKRSAASEAFTRTTTLHHLRHRPCRAPVH